MNAMQQLSIGVAALAFGVGAITFAPPALSQDDAIEEVVVTARKREESLLEIPVAITAFSNEEMDRKGYVSLQDLSFVTAGLHYNKQAGQIPGRYNTAVRFRGMDTNQSAASQQLGTVFLDGVYMSNGVAGIDFSNIERVEVIKGPQSATFGRSTFAGAVNYVTRTPGFEYRGRLAADFSEFGGYDVAVSHEGPIVRDQLSYRVSVRTFGTDGQYVSAADGGDLGKETTETVQGTLFWQPTDNFSLKLRGLWSHDDDGPPAAVYLASQLAARGSGEHNAGTNCFRDRPQEQAGGAVADYYCGPVPVVDIDRFIATNTISLPFEQRTFGASSYTNSSTGETWQKIDGVPIVTDPGLKRHQRRWALLMDYEFDSGPMEGYTISSVSGYNDMRANWVRDFDLTRTNDLMSQDPQLHEDVSQELRITSPQDNRFRWSLGYSYFDVEYVQQGNGGVTVSCADGGCGAIIMGVFTPGPNVGGSTNFPIEGGTTTGIFGSLAFDITEKLTVDFEWRDQEDEISQDEPTTPELEGTATFDAFLPRFTVSYNPTENSTVWATYSEGNLPGFFNTDLAPLSQEEFDQVGVFLGAAPNFFNDEEELENTEIGWKQRFDNGFYFSLVYYELDWTNLKTRQGIPIILDNGSERVLNLQFNAGNAELDGLELEGGFSIGDNFSGNFTINSVNGKYGALTCGFSPFKAPVTVPGGLVAVGQRDCAGNTPSRFPDLSGSVGLNWVDNLRDSEWDYYLFGQATYFGKAFNEEANFSWIGEFWRVNLRGGFEKENFRIEGYVNNLFDDDNYLAGARWSDFSTGITFGFVFSQGIALTPPEQRTFGIKAVYEF